MHVLDAGAGWGNLWRYNRDAMYRKFLEALSEDGVFICTWGGEIQAVFPVVEKHAYVITLHFSSAEEFMEYIQQVCRPVRESLELRRREFLQYLEQYKNEQGLFAFERDTYLYCCRN